MIRKNISVLTILIGLSQSLSLLTQTRQEVLQKVDSTIQKAMNDWPSPVNSPFVTV